MISPFFNIRVVGAVAAFLLVGTARVVVAECEHQISPSPLRVCATGQTTTFTLGAQAPFHVTQAPVQDVRTVTVPGTGVLLVLWEEQTADDSWVPHYAISLDGDSVTRVEATAQRASTMHLVLNWMTSCMTSTARCSCCMWRATILQV